MTRLIELRTLGITGVIGIGLLLAAGSMYLSAVEPLLSELAKQLGEEQRLDAKLKVRLKSTDIQNTPVPRLPMDTDTETTLPPLPALSEAPILFDQLYGLGERRNILLERGSYNLMAHAKPSVNQYQVTLPLKCAYPEMRRFLHEALALAPVASLDSISVQRAKASDPVPDVSVTLSYYFAIE